MNKKHKIRITFAIVFTVIDFLSIMALANWQFTPYVFSALTDLLFMLQFKIEEECEEDDEKGNKKADDESSKQLRSTDSGGNKNSTTFDGDIVDGEINKTKQKDS